MKRSFKVSICIFTFTLIFTSFSSAQTTFILEDFSTAAATTSPNWSIFLLNGNDNMGAGAWRFDNPGGRAALAPFTSPFAISDSDFAGLVAFTSALVSAPMNAAAANQVIVDFDYMFRQLGATATMEVYDGTSWNVAATLAQNDTGAGTNTRVSFNVTTLMAGTSKGRIRFAHTANFDWWYAVDNIHVFEPNPVDVACGPITAPTFSAFDCVQNLGASETISLDIINNGGTSILPGSLISITVILDGTTVLTEFTSPIVALTSGSTLSYTTTGTVNLSAGGTHTLQIITTTIGDSNALNDTCTVVYTSPSFAPRNYGYSESFDTLPSNGGSFTMTVFAVPTAWENAQNDAASLAGNSAPDWGPNSGTTGSNQGPSADATTGSASGIYMYIEDSSSQAGDIELRSPCLDTSGGVGSPTVQFQHFSHAPAALTSDNVLEIDVINETSGGVVAMSVATLPGYGVNTWNKVQVDLTAFVPDIVKIQFRTNNNNGTFTDDVSIDDFLFFDSFTPTGQAPQLINATYDINNAYNNLGLQVQSGSPGPYLTQVTAGGTMTMSWTGQNNGIVLCLFGPANNGVATFPGVGQLDIGTLPLDGNGIPGFIFIFGDGSPGAQFPFGPLFNSFFATGPAGSGGVSFQIPNFVPGPLTRFQCVMNPGGLFFLSNAVDVVVF